MSQLDNTALSHLFKRIKMNIQQQKKRSSRVFRREHKDQEMLWSSSEPQSIHPAWMLQQESYFSARGSERYFLQLATFTVIMIHSHVHMSVFLCTENRMFCVPSLANNTWSDKSSSSGNGSPHPRSVGASRSLPIPQEMDGPTGRRDDDTQDFF